MKNLINRILVPIDFSEYSKAALSYSVDLATNFNSELILIYVVEPVIYPPDFSMGQIALPTVDSEMDSRAADELARLSKSEIPGEIKCRTIVKTGKPFLEIIECAQEENIDLIIIASHGHTGVEHILFGSTADKVVKKAPCPVLTIREPLKGFDYKKAFTK